MAVISGAVVRLVYRSISCFRQIVKHGLVLTELEDFVFWISAALYLFVQIYHTSSGSIRWYFVLGVVLGAGFVSLIIYAADKTAQKKHHAEKKNLSKSIEKAKEKR